MTILLLLRRAKISQHYVTAASPSTFFAYQFKVGPALKAHQLHSLPTFPAATQPNALARAFSHDAGGHRWHQQPRIQSLLKVHEMMKITNQGLVFCFPL